VTEINFLLLLSEPITSDMLRMITKPSCINQNHYHCSRTPQQSPAVFWFKLTAISHGENSVGRFQKKNIFRSECRIDLAVELYQPK